MGKLFNLDSIDLEIMSFLNDDPEISCLEIGKHVNRTQPAIRTRIIKLRKQGYERIFGVNFKKINVVLTQVCIQTSDTHHISELIDNQNRNIGKILVWTTTDKYNLNMLICGKSIKEIEKTVNTLLKNEKNIMSIKFEVIYSLLTEFVLPINNE